MKPIKTEFNREGFSYVQIWRQKDIALYQYGTPPAYELIIIQIGLEEKLPSGTILPLREVYPRTSWWGKYGWSLGSQDRELAIYIGEEIVDLPNSERIPKVHAIMDRWKWARARLKSGTAEDHKALRDAFNPQGR